MSLGPPFAAGRSGPGTAQAGDATGRYPIAASVACPADAPENPHPIAFALFDLDGTVIRPGSALQREHMGAMAAAVSAVSGCAERFRYVQGRLHYGSVDLAGFTDAGTIVAALGYAGVPVVDATTLVPAIVADMVRRLPTTAVGGDAAADLLRGSAQLVSRLHAAGVAVGLSTGNARAVAAWKMHRTGLAGLLRRGGFGDVATDRDDVVATAVVQLRGDGPGRVPGVLFGDTVKDVTAAHRAGLACVAVATGECSPAELAGAGADCVLADLTDPAALPALRRLLERSATGGDARLATLATGGDQE